MDRSQHRLVECQEQLADLENLLEKAEERERVLVEEVKTKEEEFARTIYDYEYIIKELEKDQAVRLEEVNKKYEIKLAEANG